MPSCHHLTHHVISSVHAEYPPLINLVVLLALDWLFYNSKSFKLNESTSLFKKRNRKTFSYLWAFIRVIYSAITMTGPYAHRSFYWNLLPAGKDELARTAPRAPTNDNNTHFYTLAVSCVITSTLAPLLAFAELVVKYTNANMQRATQLALELFV